VARCFHDLEVISCADCRPRTSAVQTVYATPGGGVVHRRPDCEMLARGQASVDAAGGRTGAINPADRNKYPGRGDCTWCMAEKVIGTCKINVNDVLLAAVIINTRPLSYGHLAYLVRYQSADGKVVEKQCKKLQLIDLQMNNA